MRFLLWSMLLVVGLVLVGCGEPQERLKVGWMGDGEYAVVSVIKGNDIKNTYKIRCKENNVNTPFDYVWEYDCDLNTNFNGFTQDWDNPEDDRFEDRRYEGSGERYYRDDDDDDDGIDIGDVALGAVIGSTLKGKKKPTTVVTKPVQDKPVKTVTKKKVVKKVVKKKPRKVVKKRPVKRTKSRRK